MLPGGELTDPIPPATGTVGWCQTHTAGGGGGFSPPSQCCFSACFGCVLDFNMYFCSEPLGRFASVAFCSQALLSPLTLQRPCCQHVAVAGDLGM